MLNTVVSIDRETTDKVGQMMFFVSSNVICQTYSRSNVIMVDERSPHSSNTIDISTKSTLLCSVYQAPLNELSFNQLSWILPKITYLSMQLIPRLDGATGSALKCKNR